MNGSERGEGQEPAAGLPLEGWDVPLEGWASSVYEKLESAASLEEMRHHLVDLRWCLLNMQALLKIRKHEVQERERQVSAHAGRNGMVLMKVRRAAKSAGLKAPASISEIPDLVQTLVERP